MAVTVHSASTMTFERFWSWLQDHPACILRAGTPDCFLYDQEDFHWVFSLDGERNPVVELLRGKRLIGDLVLDIRDVTRVQASPDLEHPEHIVFEVMSDVQGTPTTVYEFLMAHGIEEPTHKGEYKH